MSNDDFYRRVLTIPIAQILRGLQFDTAELSSLEILIDVLKTFIEETGCKSKTNAEFAGRTEVNFHDLRLALLDMGITLDDVMSFSDEVSINYELSNFPDLTPSCVDLYSTVSYSQKPRPPYVFSFLPPYPDLRRTDVYNEVENKPRKINEMKTQIQTQAENNIANLRQYASSSQDIVNYDQTNDPKVSQHQSTLFKGAKDPTEMVAAIEPEEKPHYTPATNLAPDFFFKRPENVVPMEDDFSVIPEPLEEDDPKAVKILSLEHKSGIQTLPE